MFVEEFVERREYIYKNNIDNYEWIGLWYSFDYFMVNIEGWDWSECYNIRLGGV